MISLLVALTVIAAEPETARQERVVFAAPQGMLLDFTATWCGPCQQMAPIVSRLERQGYPIRKVDIDKERSLAQQYGIATIPCFVLVVNGREVNRVVGQTSEAELKRMLSQIPTEPQPPVATSNPPSRPLPVRPVSDDGSLAGRDETENNAPRKKNSLFPNLFGSRRDNPPAAPLDENATIRGKDEDPLPDAPSTPTKDPMTASARIKVRDPNGINFGTGSIIVSKPGRTLILTCGHLFRDLKSDSTIEVDIFQAKNVRKYVAKLVDFDLKSDVGLISIATDSTLPVVTVAAMNQPLAVGDRLVSIGCGGGEAPSMMPARVTALNRYQGPDNIECTGLPIPGRSGGGLFNAEGEVVGLCFAADESENRGLYTGLKPIYALLQRAKILPSRSSGGETEPELGDGASAIAGAPASPLERATANDAAIEFGGATSQPPVEERSAPLATADASADERIPSAPDLSDIGESEVVCIIRPVNDPDGASQIVIINRASPRFMRYLQGEFKSGPKPTSARFPFDPTMNLSANLAQIKSKPTPKTTPVPTRFQRYTRSAASR